MADNQAVLWRYMAVLNEYCQKRQLKFHYKDVDVTGPPHDRIFTVKVVIEEREYTPATGKSKKEARSHAAKLAWDAIQQESQALPVSPPLPQLQPSPSPPPAQLPQRASDFADVTSSSSVNFISFLNNYGLKNKVTVQYPLKDKRGEDHKPKFCCTCEIGGEIYGEGIGNNKQTAKFNAAKQAYERLRAQSAFRETSENASVNGMDSGLGVNDRLATEIGAVQLNDVSSPALASPRLPAVKPKRKDALLAPTFANLRQSESRNTTNVRFLEEYEVIKKIGDGGFGHVFEAKHKIDKRVCAVKRVKLISDENETADTKREVEALAGLLHENIVRYYGCWIGKDTVESEDSRSDNRSPCNCLFIEMEFCEKGTLLDWINRKRGTKRFRNDSLMKFRQIVEGVAYIHSQKLIHRDLKPKNILISNEDKIKISDFGLVTSCIDDPSVQRTENIGTKTYMAPEQVGKMYGEKVDIFPLGLILFEMLYLFGTDYEKSKEWSNIKKCIFPQKFEKEFPTEAALIKKMLSEEPSKRPSATEILKFLNRGEQDDPHTC